jgi:hypothetical protein
MAAGVDPVGRSRREVERGDDLEALDGLLLALADLPVGDRSRAELGLGSSRSKVSIAS